MSERIAITGVGAVTCLGMSALETWRNLVEGRSGIHRITRFPSAGLKTTICGSVDIQVPDDRCSTRTQLLAERALAEALQRSALPAQALRHAPLYMGLTGWEFEWDDRRAQIRAARESGGSFMAQYAHAGNTHELVRDGGLLGALQRRFGLYGRATGVTTACASGASAIELAVRAIRRGQTPIAVAGAADASVCPEGLIRFSLLSTLSRANDDPARASKPFSKQRDGFVMAEGAAFLILESEAHALARGRAILGFVLGVGSSSDAFHRTRSRPDGSGGVQCLERALRDAGVSASQVDYVNAHGTSTPENDRMETHVLKRVLGEHARRALISSNKSMLGHTLAAAGAVEAVMTVLTLQTGIIPPTINYVADEELDLNYVPNRAVHCAAQLAMSNSFGFGGQNVSIVLGRAEPA